MRPLGGLLGYFAFTSRYLDSGRNQLSIGDYLARVNFTFFDNDFYFLLLLSNISKIQR